jgi:hypothetical protein
MLAARTGWTMTETVCMTERILTVQPDLCAQTMTETGMVILVTNHVITALQLTAMMMLQPLIMERLKFVTVSIIIVTVKQMKDVTVQIILLALAEAVQENAY